MIDDELLGAADDLRRAVNNVAVPPFEPRVASAERDEVVPITAATRKRRTFPARVVAVAASVALIAVGAVTVLQFTQDQETTAVSPVGSEQAAASQPIREGSETTTSSVDSSWANGVSGTQEVPEEDVARPDLGESVVDPTFGTTIQSVGESSSVASFMPLQVRPAWNADGSRLLMYRSDSGFSIVDAETLVEGSALPINPADIEQVYWHPANPDLLYFVDNADSTAVQLKSFNVETSSAATVYTYDGCTRVSGFDSIRISAERLNLGQLCMTDDGPFMVTVNLVTGAALRVPAGDFGAPQPTPSSGRYVARTADGRVAVLDDQLRPTGVEFAIGDDAVAVIETAQGKELLVTTIFSGDDNVIGSVVAFDLADGSPTVVVGPSSGYPYPPAVGGLATSVANDGRVVLATEWDPEQSSLTGEIIVIDFDQPSPVVTRVVHHRSTAQNADDSAWSRPYPSLHPRETVVAFASDWGGETASPFIVSD